DRRGQRSENTPGDHDARDPKARPDFLHDHITGHLEQEVAPVECSYSKTERGGRHVEVTTHGQAGEAYIDAVDIGEEGGDDGERQQAQVNLAHRRFFNSSFHRALLFAPDGCSARKGTAYWSGTSVSGVMPVTPLSRSRPDHRPHGGPPCTSRVRFPPTPA